MPANPINIEILEAIDAIDLADYPSIVKVSTGGVNSDGFTYSRSKKEYASGTFSPGHAYWIYVDNDMQLIFNMYNYKAWGIGGDIPFSKAKSRVNGVTYTVLAYSTLDIDSSSANTSGEATIFVGTLMDKDVPHFQINDDYTNKAVRIKVFKGTTDFNDTTYIGQTEPMIANRDYVTYPNIAFTNPDDFRPLEPSDTNIEMPPSAPVF